MKTCDRTPGRSPFWLGLVLLLAGCSSAPAPRVGGERWIWVNRWDWRGPQDISRVMADCAEAGFSAVLFQVRGNGTVLYDSALEPWSERFGHRSPGYDPLAMAVREAHRHGLQLHAWVNLIPGWRGATPPADPDQLYLRRPEWFLTDAAGRREPLAAGRYLSLNPCLPEVRSYLTGLCVDLAERYPVDGIHLDYVRFVAADYGAGVYPADPVSLRLFREETGSEAAEDRAGFARWKTAAITRLVAGVREQLERLPHRPMLTAAVIADPVTARERHHQDWGTWAERRLVDVLFPMNYTQDDAAFARVTRAGVGRAAGTPVVVGVGAYRHTDPQQTVAQMDAALRLGAAGVGVYAYAKVFDREAPGWRHALTGWNIAQGR